MGRALLGKLGVIFQIVVYAKNLPSFKVFGMIWSAKTWGKTTSNIGSVDCWLGCGLDGCGFEGVGLLDAMLRFALTFCLCRMNEELRSRSDRVSVTHRPPHILHPGNADRFLTTLRVVSVF